MKRRMTISRGGQISIPAEVRRRWSTSAVSIVDEGDRLVVRPAPEDPIAAAEGALARYGPVDIAELRRIAREDEEAAEERRRI